MLLSYLTLKKWFQCDISLETITAALNNLGYEVEQVVTSPTITGIRYGRILSIRENEHARRLSICEIECADRVRIIQTAATNVKVGAYVIVFIEGASRGGHVYEARKMREVISEGMLASWEELGIDGILMGETDGVVLLETADLASDPIQDLQLNDSLIDVTILSNRDDAHCYVVLAQELAAYLHVDINIPAIVAPPYSTTTNISDIPNSASFIVKADSVTTELSERVWVASHGHVADTPYATLSSLLLIYYGVYNIYYDEERVGVTERRRVDTFEGSYEALVNDSGIVCYLGCDVEEQYRVDATTCLIRYLMLLPTNKITRDIGQIATRALHQNGAVTRESIRYYSEVIRGYISHRIPSAAYVSSVSTEPAQYCITFDDNYLTSYVGADTLDETRAQLSWTALAKLGFIRNGENVTIPPHRRISYPAELVEEFMRFYGYDAIAPSQPYIRTHTVRPYSNLQERVATLGYQEVATYTLTSTQHNTFNPLNISAPEILTTYTSRDRLEVRRSMFNTLREVLEYNCRRKMKHFSIFDVGMIATEKISLILATSVYDHITVRSHIHTLFPNRKLEYVRVESGSNLLVPSVSAWILEDGVRVGWVGRVYPSIFEHNFLICELILANAEDTMLRPARKIVFQPFTKTNVKHRSVTYTIDETVGVGQYYQRLVDTPGVIQVYIRDRYRAADGLRITFDVLIESGYERGIDEESTQ